MKKLNVFLIAALLSAGCASTSTSTHIMTKEEIDKAVKEYFTPVQEAPAVQTPTPEQTDSTTCQISGHECWEVAQLFKLGTESNKEQRSTKLQAMGLTVTFSTMYRDGGSWDYQLSDGTRLHVSNSVWNRSGDIKITLPGGQTFQYDAQGNRK